MSHPQILVVDDDPLVHGSLAELFRGQGYGVTTATSGEEGLHALEQDHAHFDVMLLDVSMPGLSGFEVLEQVRERYPDIAIILITAYGSIADAVEAIKLGAFHYVTKPLIDDEVMQMVEQCLEERDLRSENVELRRQVCSELELGRLVGDDPKMLQIYQLVGAVADTQATVLITGESGTGKSLLARAIHHNSSRAGGPFVEVSCGAIPETLLESEIFGHAKGAFTGADFDKDGKFQLADGGTIFLDEISTASPALQVKLLRVIQDQTFEKVGGRETVQVDTRLIVATNQDLAALVQQGRFREDLYYRAHVITIPVPPLREHPGDILLLTRHFSRKYGRAQGGRAVTFTEEAQQVLLSYSWPGNIRELENVIERAAILCSDSAVTAADIEPALQPGRSDPELSRPIIPLKEALMGAEKEYIRRVLEECNGNRNNALAVLGISRSTLFNKMREYGFLDMFP